MNYSLSGDFCEGLFKNTFLNGHKITTVFTRKKGWSLKDSSFGNLRVCNLSPDIYNADVYANKYKILGDLDYLGISKYMCIIPDTYDFSIKEAKGDKTILNCGHQRIEKGGFNTIYLIGRINSNPSLRCVFSVDAMTYNGKDL